MNSVEAMIGEKVTTVQRLKNKWCTSGQMMRGGGGGGICSKLVSRLFTARRCVDDHAVVGHVFLTVN